MLTNRYLQASSLLVGLFVIACSGESTGGTSSSGQAGGPPVAPAPDLGRDILHTGLDIDLATKTATATIDFAPSPGTGATLEADGLAITGVKIEKNDIAWAFSAGKLDLGIPIDEAAPSRVVIEYGFKEQNQFEGLMASGSTLVWPYFCGNLFPCHSNPADGTTFELSVKNTPMGETTIYPPSIPTDAPSYQIAWATGKYATLDLGTSNQGTHLSVHYFEGALDKATLGSAHLKDVFDFYEANYGAYPFGTEAGAVEADWGPLAYGGMEHHPLFHISKPAIADPWIYAHEAAHGWFGDGVRIACWEDFVLSEGTVSYLEARAVAATQGAAEGQKVWDHYKGRLDNAMAGTAPKIAWPDGCGKIDILKDNLFGDIVYIKGAYFFKALEAKIGVTLLDKSLQAFFIKYRNKAAGFVDLLAIVKSISSYDATTCAQNWLRTEAVPADAACL